ncbi:MAG: polysaccharide deacetylase family protein [Oscillospiraceae bacterium]|nr:polysaccharide deacetylase family protein [Oscillospiraceae bacterium]
MEKHSKNTYRSRGSRKRKILIRRWTLIILVLFILLGGTALAVRLISEDDDIVKPPVSSPTPVSAQPSETPSMSPEISLGPDKASPKPSASPLSESEEPAEAGVPGTEEPIGITQGTVTAASVELSSPNLLEAINKPDGIKTAYLTFDDGPTNSVTSKILDTLRRYNIKATFFEIGSGIEANPDMARRVYDEGHLLANHSYSHNYKNIYVTAENFMEEVTKTEELILSITGEETVFKLFRFPGGSFKSDKDSWSKNKQEYKELLKENGYVYCDWNSYNGDAEGGTKTKDKLVEELKSSVGTKEDIVILMHDAAAKGTTAEALPEICEYLISQGYEFRRLDEFNK